MPEVERIGTENARRMRWQRVGFGALCMSFALQVVATLL